jgi:hypothetical protein
VSKWLSTIHDSPFFRYLIKAVEYLAEWCLNPTNVAFLRVQTGVCDPSLVGDKCKWFEHELEPLVFQVWDDNSTLAGVLRSASELENLPTGHTHILYNNE